MCNSDLILEKIKNLSEKVEIFADHNNRERDQVIDRLSLINDSLVELDSKVNTQNGRIGKVENNQKHCPGQEIKRSFAMYQQELKPVYILATNIKLIAIIIIAAALVFNIVNAAMSYLINIFS
jgi:hypothetical protein